MERLIIYPTDFSACAENALTFAIEIAQKMNCNLKAVHAINVAGISASEATPMRVLDEIKLLERKAGQQLGMVKDIATKHHVVCESEVIKGGRLIPLLIEYLKESNPLLVVMGTTGSGNKKNKIMGSLTHKVIKNTKPPVLAIPQKASFKGFRKLIFATDYHKSDMEHLKFLTELGKCFDAGLKVVHVATSNDYQPLNSLDEFKYYISEVFNYSKIDFRLLLHEDVEERLAILLKESNADLLALVTRKRSLFNRLFDTSLTKKMIYHTHTPMLVFS